MLLFKNILLKLILPLFLASGMMYACKSISQMEGNSVSKTPRVLVFTKTKGWYHTSIPSGIAALQKMGKENGFNVDTTKDAGYFNEDSLKNYNAIVFLSTTLDVLNPDQQVAMERYIQAGGGYAGIHAASDTEFDWPWYNKLVGAYFLNHPGNPNVRTATIDVIDTSHISTIGLPKRWERTDEWYNYRNIQPGLKVLANLDEDTYEGGENGKNHPIAWYHEFDGGRAFYTGGGHTDESFSEPLFLQHLLGGIKYAIGDKSLDYSKAYSVKKPEDNRFMKSILSNDLNEPMELAVAPDGRVFFIERAGNFYVYDPKTEQTSLVYKFPVEAVDKYLNGLLGMTIDPDFETNNFIYFFNTKSSNGNFKQHISRFTITENSELNLSSEKVIIEIPIDLEVSAHTGGSMAWDRDKNLYISTGDNTVPFESQGYAPIDRRPDRLVFNAERSAANTNDLRGKILKIHPETDGSYTIPDGNLFPKGTANTRPEIYIMGCRNPYRISVDQETSILYWGEVGPDAGTNGIQGPMGYDEFNQAKEPGNYGWPYFVGDNYAYKEYDFASKVLGKNFNFNEPENISPYNTGLKILPPARKPLVWYPYSLSTDFPLLGQGGRCAMGGPVYNYNAELRSDTKMPAYYDKALFIYDWMRNWVFAVRMDENQQYKRMEPFMETNGDFRRPIDLEIGPEGSFYMLEYGSVYGIDNVDARLVRIDYNGGNRSPVAKIVAKDTIGMAPFKVNFDQSSYDFDEDSLSYQWTFEDKEITSTEPKAVHTFTENGKHLVKLKVTDVSGLHHIDSVHVIIGNTMPKVSITTQANTSFYPPKPHPFPYNIEVIDKEDHHIEPNRVSMVMNYIAKIGDEAVMAGHQQIQPTYNYGNALIAKSDCKACHQINGKSVGPSFTDISKKYTSTEGTVSSLADKIIKGGGGVWGEHAMNAHPQISKPDAEEIVNYILTLDDKKAEQIYPASGELLFKDHLNAKDEGRYILLASYTDNGGINVPRLTSGASLALRPTRVEAESADRYVNLTRQARELRGISNRSYFVLKSIDLKGIKQLTYRYSAQSLGATLVVRSGALNGPVLSSVFLKPTIKWDNFAELSSTIKDPGTKKDLYFIFEKAEKPNQNLIRMDWINFEFD